MAFLGPAFVGGALTAAPIAYEGASAASIAAAGGLGAVTGVGSYFANRAERAVEDSTRRVIRNIRKRVFNNVSRSTVASKKVRQAPTLIYRRRQQKLPYRRRNSHLKYRKALNRPVQRRKAKVQRRYVHPDYNI